MARLSIAVLALLAVAAVVSAGPPPPGPPAGGLKGWLQNKEAQLKQWAGQEKNKIQAAWQQTVVPQVRELAQKLGAKWQEKAPKVAALLREKAGGAFDKAVKLVQG